MKIKQRWNTYKRDRWLRECKKGREETEFMFGRLREVCDRLGIARAELDIETRHKVLALASKEFRSKKKDGYDFSNAIKNPYVKIETEELPENLRDIVEHAFLHEYMTGFFWTLYEWKSRWFIKVQHINKIGRSLWLSVRVTKTASDAAADEKIYLDFFRSDFDELTKFKGLYYSERNKALFFHVFRSKDSEDKKERQEYEKWINQLEGLGLLFEEVEDGQTGSGAGIVGYAGGRRKRPILFRRRGSGTHEEAVASPESGVPDR